MAQVQRWTRGEEEPDAEARRGLDELARDPVLLARMEKVRRLATERLAELEREEAVAGPRKRPLVHRRDRTREP